MSLISDMYKQWAIVCSTEKTLEHRIFTACELLCKPISFFALLMIPGWPILQKLGVVIPSWIVECLHPICVSAAIGYLTNWVAIEMLFKPYERTWKHPFAWITLGYWRQGLVPKNKAQIAKTIGEKVSGQLLQPEKLAVDLCDMVGGLLENKEIIGQIQNEVKNQVISHKQQIIDFLSPQIEAGIITEIDKLLTAENVQNFWDSQIEPRLASEDFRNRLTNLVVDTIEKKAPAIAEKIRPALVKLITDYCKEKTQGLMGGVLAPVVNPLAEGLADRMLSNQTIENGISNWINSPETPATLSEGLTNMVTTIREYIKSPERNNDISQFVSDLRNQFKGYLEKWLQDKLPSSADSIIRNESLWNWGTSLLTSSKPQLEKFIQEKGMPMILEKLNIQGRIQSAVDNQDMHQFHEMINDVVAQHLGAIQVLGFVLGGLAGALMILF